MLKGKNKNALIIPLLAVLSGFIVGAVLMLVFGYNPKKPPTRIESHGVAAPNALLKDNVKTVLLKAPTIIIPSSPTLTMPLRSENVPPKAVKINGAA